MARYRLASKAEEDLIRIHQWGVERFGVKQADSYIYQLFERFDEIARAPRQFQKVDEIRPGYHRAVCGRDTIYFRARSDIVEIMAIIGQQELDSL